MTTTFPTSLDDTADLPVTILGSSLRSSPDHAGQHNTLSGAVVALETKVGADSSAVTTSHDYKIRDLNDATLFLVNGVTYPLTRAGIASALSAASSVAGTVRLCADVTADGTSLAIPSNVTLDLGGHLLTAPSSGSTDLITVTGTLGSSVNLDTNATMGAKTIVLAAGGGASFAAGDIVRIFEETSRYYCQVAEIRSISTDTLTLVDSVKHAFTTGNGTKIRKVTPVTGARVINGRFSGNNNTDTTRAINASYTDGLTVADCAFDDFPEAAVKCETGLHTELRGIHTDDCGSGSESDVMLFRQTYYHCIDVHSHGAKGFGPQSAGGAGGEWVSCVSHDANGRAMKLAYEGWTNIVGSLGDGARGGYTGISVTLFSHDCDVVGSSAQGNTSYGFMLDSTIRCRLIACKGQGNTTADATHDDIDGTPSGNQFIDCSFDGGYADGASSSDLIVRGTTRTWRIPLIPVLARAANAGSGVLLDPFPWAVDAHASFTTDTGHVDIADNDAAYPKIAMASIPVPADYVSGGRIVIHWSTPATSGDALWAMQVREDFASGDSGASSLTTILNEGTAAVGLITQTITGSANIRREVKSGVFGVAPTIGRMLEIAIWSPSNNASDTLSAQRTFWGAWLEYTKRDF